jgi:hypothetical protein
MSSASETQRARKCRSRPSYPFGLGTFPRNCCYQVLGTTLRPFFALSAAIALNTRLRVCLTVATPIRQDGLQGQVLAITFYFRLLFALNRFHFFSLKKFFIAFSISSAVGSRLFFVVSSVRIWLWISVSYTSFRLCCSGFGIFRLMDCAQ